MVKPGEEFFWCEKAPAFSGRTRQVDKEKTGLPVFWVDLEANILF